MNKSLKTCASPGVAAPAPVAAKSPFSRPRDFLDNRFVYLAVSSRARGLSIGINMNPDKQCNFDCVYCDVDRHLPSSEKDLDLWVMETELEKTLFLVTSGQIRERFPYSGFDQELLELRHVALSGDGEPTLCLGFAGAVEAVVHVRARKSNPFFKIVLITNGAGLDRSCVEEGLRYFTMVDEIWIKLEAGTQAYMDRVNRSEVPLEKVLQNALSLGRKRPIVIQSLFVRMSGQEPPQAEIDEYIRRLNELKDGGAQISLVQVYSAMRPTIQSDCDCLSLKELSLIRRRIKTETGLYAEVF